MKNWLNRHLQVLFYTLGQFARNRASVAMTLLALGIGFSIPLIMYSLVDAIANIGGQWQERPQITLYLGKSTQQAEIDAIASTLTSDNRFTGVRFISADQGLQEFSAQQRFGEAIALLDENPLPDVFVVFPASDKLEDIAALTRELGLLSSVQSAQYDYEWLQKLAALTSFLKRAVVILAGIIAIGILLLIANTIRLEISQRKDEIEIIDQLGGSPSFIARPFLYMGFLEGLFGGCMAIIISALALSLLNAPLLRLAELYGFAFELPYIRIDLTLTVLLVSSLLGWLSAAFTVIRHMREMAPA